jgi:transcriptional regulator with XRE-family HTH domain
MTIGERIKARRIAKGMSVKEIARASGLAVSTLYDIERGDQRSTTKLHLIADALGTTPADLEHGGPLGLREDKAAYRSHKTRSSRLARLVQRLHDAEDSGLLTPSLLGLIEDALDLALGAKR